MIAVVEGEEEVLAREGRSSVRITSAYVELR